MSWNKSLSSMMEEIRDHADASSQEVALDALGQFQDMTPVGNPSLWKSPYAPKGYVGGSLRGSFTLEKIPEGYFVGSNLAYAERIWADGHSQRLQAGAIDLLIANLSNT